MTNRLDVVPVRIEHERAVVLRVIDLAQAGAAVVGRARGEGGCVERVDELTRGAANATWVFVPRSRPRAPIQKNGLPMLGSPKPQTLAIGSISGTNPSGSSAWT